MTFRRTRTAIALGIALAGSHVFAQTSAESDLARRVEQLAAELAKVQAQLAVLQQQRAAEAVDASAGAAGRSAAALAIPEAATGAAAAVPYRAGRTPGAAIASSRPDEPATVLSSYGEINYTRPTKRGENAEADLRRFIIGFQHRFDAKTKIVTELEVEHAVSSSGDPGEVAVEQAYVEHQFHPAWGVRGGLFLMPVGLLNERHEPTAYYGVHRNFVETAIIPTTWREGGVQLYGTLDDGWTVQGGVSTGFDLTKWDAASREGAESPLGSIHQELALAKSRNLAVFGALNWRGVPGLLVGGSIFSGGATHAQSAASAKVTLWDVHGRWTPGRWDLAALYSRGSLTNTAALNAPLVGNPTLIPKSFDGWYTQAAYKLWSQGDYALSPFVRLEKFNTARAFADLGSGITPDAGPAERVITVGANFQIARGVVLKADLQRFRENRDANRVNLGLGWSF